MGNYLYNGVPLPDIYSAIPTDQREQCPHIVIFDAAVQLGKTGDYRILAMSEPCIITVDAYYDNWTGKYVDQMIVPATVQWLQYKLNTAQDGWELGWESDGTSVIKWEDAAFVWANYDLTKSDGTLYLAASEPVPVSTYTPNPAAMVNGWLMGQAVRRMRGQL